MALGQRALADTWPHSQEFLPGLVQPKPEGGQFRLGLRV